MAIHVLKNTNQEIVLKIVCENPAGEAISVPLSSLKKDDETYIAADVRADVVAAYWGINKDKICTMERSNDGGTTWNLDWYFTSTGSYEFKYFVDNFLEDGDFRLSFDGRGSVILVIRKSGGYVNYADQNANYGVYNDPTADGAIT